MDGAALAKEIRQGLSDKVPTFTRETGVVPCLATVLVGRRAGQPAGLAEEATQDEGKRRWPPSPPTRR